MTLAVRLTERELQAQVTQLATMLGWTWAHFRPAQTSKGWRTPVSGPLGMGWPDLVLVRMRDRRTMYVELKADDGRLTPEQALVLAELATAGLETHVWRPRDLDAIAVALR